MLGIIVWKCFRPAVLLLACFGMMQAAKAQVVITGEKDVYQFGKGDWEYLKTGDTLPVDKIVAAKVSGAFHPLNQAVLNGGIADGYYWIHFTVTNVQAAGAPLVIAVESPRLNELELFETSGKEPV